MMIIILLHTQFELYQETKLRGIQRIKAMNTFSPGDYLLRQKRYRGSVYKKCEVKKNKGF